jgi:hypothetical protein
LITAHIIPDFRGDEDSVYLEDGGGIFYRNTHDNLPETMRP